MMIIVITIKYIHNNILFFTVIKYYKIRILIKYGNVMVKQ